MIEVFVFILGTVVFSFGGVCIARIPKGESVVRGRSKCDCCGSFIKWYDLVPVLSYLFLKGKCRSCGSKIPVYCIVVEIIGGIVSLLCYFVHGLSVNYVLSLMICFMLMVIGFIDQFTMDIYTNTIVVLGVFCAVYRLVNGIDILDMCLSMFVISGLLFIMLMLFKGCFVYNLQKWSI